MSDSDQGKKCPCKRTQCQRHGDCKACMDHHHNNSKRWPDTTCERMRKKEEKKKMQSD